jgi:hypothetical protein
MRRVGFAVSVLAALLLSVASTAKAQRVERPWYLEGGVAYSWATGDYGSLVRGGWGAGGVVGYETSGNIWLMGSFSATWFKGEADLFDWTNLSYFAMAGFNLAQSEPSYDTVLFLGGGGVTFNPDSDVLDSKTNFGINGGMKIIYYLKPQVGITFNGAAVYVFGSEETIGGDTVILPISLGLALRF